MHRLVYASESNIRLGESGVDLEIGRILSKSKRNNPKRSIGGVLYFGDDHFFQVLEGDESDIRNLYQIIERDTRHQNVRIILQESTESPMFGDWSMHLVPAKSQIRSLLQQYGFDKFTPFEFSQDLIKDLMALLSQNGEVSQTQTQRSGFLSGLKRLFSGSPAA